jgi:hypothetical protein
MTASESQPVSITVQTYDGKKLGTISLAGNDLTGSAPVLQEMADAWLHSGNGSAVEVLKAHDGWQNGYLFASSDPAAAVA